MDRESIIRLRSGTELDTMMTERIDGKCAHNLKKRYNNEWMRESESFFECTKCGERFYGSNIKQGLAVTQYSTNGSEGAPIWELAKKYESLTISKKEWNSFHCVIEHKGRREHSFGSTPMEAICKAVLLLHFSA